MKKLNSIISFFLRRIIVLMPNQITAIFLSIAIKERLPNGKDQFAFRKKSNKYSILALDSERYRGDIDILSKKNEFRVLHIRQGWQRLLTQVFLTKKRYIYDVENAINGSDLEIQHKKTEALVHDVLSKLYKIIDIDCITIVHFKYIPDYYWTIASERLNVPCIMLYRECNVMSPIIFDMVVDMMSNQKPFKGSHVIVHNQKIKEAFIKSNFVADKQITVASALRMDSLIKKNINYFMNNFNKDKEVKRKIFTLFYFPVNSSMFGSNNSGVNVKNYYPDGNYWNKKESYFIQLHETILKLAKANREIDFIIKPKEIFMHDESWNFYKKIVSESRIDETKLDNYIVDAHADVHRLIIDSAVICGGQSSTTIESLYMGKRVILPLFCGYKDTAYFEQFPWRNYLDLFDVADNIVDFENIFYKALNSKEITKDDMKKRRDLYSICFDDLSGNAIEKYSNTITSTIESSRRDNDLD